MLISGIHTHSGPAGYFQYVLYEVGHLIAECCYSGDIIIIIAHHMIYYIASSAATNMHVMLRVSKMTIGTALPACVHELNKIMKRLFNSSSLSDTHRMSCTTLLALSYCGHEKLERGQGLGAVSSLILGPHTFICSLGIDCTHVHQCRFSMLCLAAESKLFGTNLGSLFQHYRCITNTYVWEL